MTNKLQVKYEGLVSFLKGSKAESKKAGRARLPVLADMLYWRVRYGFDALDYQVYGFAKNRNPDIRKSFMSSRTWAKVCNTVNASTPEKGFDMFKKSQVARILKDDFRRDILILEDSTREEIMAFFEKHPLFFAKQDTSYAGKGVFPIETKDFKGPMEVYLWLLENEITLLEEAIVQHPILDTVSPGCVATVRITTVVSPDGEVSFYSPLLRMGEGDVDHIISGQFYAPLDDEGVIFAPAFKQDGDFELRGGDFLSHHPHTGTELVGFKVPFYKEAKQMCHDMALKVKSYPFIGWDLAITEEGPALLEGNKFPANDIIQVYKYHPQERGLYHEITKALGL